VTDDVEVAVPIPTLLSADDAMRCPPCDWYHGPAVRACGQCGGGRLEPVRIEVHSRESPRVKEA